MSRVFLEGVGWLSEREAAWWKSPTGELKDFRADGTLREGVPLLEKCLDARARESRHDRKNGPRRAFDPCCLATYGWGSGVSIGWSVCGRKIPDRKPPDSDSIWLDHVIRLYEDG
jgi:hypothetical protein